ncbi:hypothetical protein [uncultured Tessaracoccus sp.]|uniref:hypothetical protein n=1 Tax=uncultured Tessaracoccus sp. TaxID=905023 RepID=UPI0026266687|nr:hypothetical protein [uncultured Tessaracoccus sp.]
MSRTAELRFLLAKWTVILAASIVLVVAFWPQFLPVAVFSIFIVVALYKITVLLRKRATITRATP